MWRICGQLWKWCLRRQCRCACTPATSTATTRWRTRGTAASRRSSGCSSSASTSAAPTSRSKRCRAPSSLTRMGQGRDGGEVPGRSDSQRREGWQGRGRAGTVERSPVEAMPSAVKPDKDGAGQGRWKGPRSTRCLAPWIWSTTARRSGKGRGRRPTLATHRAVAFSDRRAASTSTSAAPTTVCSRTQCY